MKLLPSEQIKSLEQLPALLQQIEQGLVVVLSEPCDCGYQIRHSNGGNYHQITTLAKDMGEYYIIEGSTSEFDNAEWAETNLAHIESVLRVALVEDWNIENSETVNE